MKKKQTDKREKMGNGNKKQMEKGSEKKKENENKKQIGKREKILK
jgi:hypothetical protein